MGSQTVFGPRGSATVLSKATTISAIAFMFTSLTLSILATRAGSSTPDILKKAIPAAGQPIPVQPQAPAPAGTAPITVTPGEVGGQKGSPVKIPVPPPTQPPATQPPQK
jgi:preprotein translocase subunit SecG